MGKFRGAKIYRKRETYWGAKKMGGKNYAAKL